MKAKSLFLLLLGLISASAARAQIRLDLESGLVFGTPYNRIRIPNQGGTLVDIGKELDVKPKVFFRLRAGYTINNRHTISALYAPLTVRYDGAFRENVSFNAVVFEAGKPVEVNYKFNSYRLTYRYDFVANEHWRVGAGVTAKIRDAKVRYKNDTKDTNFDNFGFVPLINFYASWQPGKRWGVLVEGDALGSKQGRAEDIFAGATYALGEQAFVKLGYRVVEGGADVDRVYTFNWINYASVGLVVEF
ncbi:porin family protein [Siphonobacter curvatus]|uniref:Uncharacterized protein n=1 Tax=Siphonobacter curvatus TaxID=2094562 RepID=A0A2S7ISC2_9BACT|nr:outer membrane beta-barrel protein [Siphonobacter curvatus]PQA60594.1 hypothetical protein C5O19_13550 [Siphonobacter curvatus]